MIALLLAIATGALWATGYGWVATMTGGLFLGMVVFYYPLRSVSDRRARYERPRVAVEAMSRKQFETNGRAAGMSRQAIASAWSEYEQSGGMICEMNCSGGVPSNHARQAHQAAQIERLYGTQNRAHEAEVTARHNAKLPDHLTLSGQSRQNAIENDPEGWTNPARFRELPDGMKTADHYPQPQRAGREQVHVHLDRRASARDVEQSENRPWIEPRFGRN